MKVTFRNLDHPIGIPVDVDVVENENKGIVRNLDANPVFVIERIVNERID